VRHKLERNGVVEQLSIAGQLGRLGAAVDRVDAASAARLLHDWAGQVREEVLIAHPGGGRSVSRLQRSHEADLVILRREATLQVLLQHATRNHGPTRQWAAKIIAGGGQVRTVPVVPNRIIVHDRKRAMLPPGDRSASDRAVVVRDPVVVGFMVAVHQVLWAQASEYPMASRDGFGDGDTVDPALRRAVLDQLITGAKDAVTARRLGMSVRTCRRYIAAIARELGAESRFQAGVLAQRAGLLDP
jgi:DNA-binding CsgD family transcriptional regulator